MAKDKDAGSWKLEYEINEKDNSASPLINATIKHNPGKVRVSMDGGIPEMDREQLAAVYLLLKEKIEQINGTLATQPGNHIASLRIIATYCTELANLLSVQEVVDDAED